MGGVLFANGTRKSIDFLVKTKGIRAEAASCIFNGPESWDLRTGKIDAGNFWEMVEKRYCPGTDLTRDSLRALWLDQYQLDRGVMDIAIALARKYRLGIFSCNTRERIEYLEKKHRFHGLFSFAHYSFSCGLTKLDLGFYEAGIRSNQVDPSDTLIIDDNQDCLDVAARAGLRTCLFSDLRNFSLWLEKNGL